MLDDGLRSFLLFASAMFVMLNGPLCLITRVKVFAGGPKSPIWLHRGVSWVSRLAGIAMLAAWAWDATGVLIATLLILVILAIGMFCLRDGPVWLVTQRSAFRRGRDAPAWLERGAIWFVRLTGVGGLLSVLVIGLRSASG